MKPKLTPISCFIAILTAALVVFSCGGGGKEQQALRAVIVLPEYDRSINTGKEVYFEGEAKGGKPPYTYRWEFGAGIPSSTDKTPGNVTFQFEGSYRVHFSVTDTGNDRAFDQVIIEVTREDLTTG